MSKIKVHYIETHTNGWTIDGKYMLYQDDFIYKKRTEWYSTAVEHTKENKWLWYIKDKLMKGIL